MGSYSAKKNTMLTIDPVTDFPDTGWSVSGDVAYHDSCNSGTIKYRLDLSGFTSWIFEYIIGVVYSGGINIRVGGVNGITRTEQGKYDETFNITGPNTQVLFYSDGKNSVELLKTYPVLAQSNGRTLVFNEDVNLWMGDSSCHPEYMHRFIDSFFMFKEGRLWEQDVNEIRNNYFGVQYSTKIKVAANIRNDRDRLFNKLYFQLHIDSNGKWSVPEMITPANETYPNGMKSRLHENNFKLEAGTYWADILRDMLDPQYNTQLQALFEGRVMEGNMLIIELETKETRNIKLSGIRVYSSPQTRNI